ncbi:unnamed protein product, partial [Mycena citricolor]
YKLARCGPTMKPELIRTTSLFLRETSLKSSRRRTAIGGWAVSMAGKPCSPLLMSKRLRAQHLLRLLARQAPNLIAHLELPTMAEMSHLQFNRRLQYLVQPQTHWVCRMIPSRKRRRASSASTEIQWHIRLLEVWGSEPVLLSAVDWCAPSSSFLICSHIHI